MHNPPAHSAARIREVPDSKTSSNIAPPPYSPDLSPAEYFLFLKVQFNLKGATFDTIEEIQKAVSDQLNKIPLEDFYNAMKKLETSANLCTIYIQCVPRLIKQTS
jgi:hypothetical protein